MYPKVAMLKVKEVVGKVVKCNSSYSDSKREGVVTFVCNAVRRTERRVPLKYLILEVRGILAESDTPSNATLATMGKAFRSNLTKEFGTRSSALAEGYEDLVELIARIGGVSSAVFKNNSIYRIQTLWCTLVRYDIARIGNSVDWLEILFPRDILKFVKPERKEETECSTWNTFLGRWIIQMFYYRQTDKDTRVLVDIHVCGMIWQVFSSWERAADLPLEIAFLEHVTLASFLPAREDILKCPDFAAINEVLTNWRTRNEKSALCRLRGFPLYDIKTEPDYFRYNPYSDKGPDCFNLFDAECHDLYLSIRGGC